MAYLKDEYANFDGYFKQSCQLNNSDIGKFCRSNSGNKVWSGQLIKDEIELAVQINSKVKAKIVVSQDMTNEQIEEIAKSNPTIVTALDGKPVKKAIVIKGRLVNLIV